MMTRRQLLRQTGLAGFGACLASSWLEFEVAHAETAPSIDAPSATARGIVELELQTNRPQALARFYGETLGWPVAFDGEALRVRAGGTLVRFVAAPEGGAPYYHVAWAIPSNRFREGKAWLERRLRLLAHPDGRDEFNFRSVGRRAVFFPDPAGNILELIARDELGDRATGEFGLEHLLYVNHVGLVVDDMDRTITELSAGLGLTPRYEPQPTFTTLGDAHRHLVLVPEGRLWLPEMNRGAAVTPLGVTLDAAADRALALPRLGATIALAQGTAE